MDEDRRLSVNLTTYVETRFNLLIETLNEAVKTLNMRMDERDKRYQQRFDDQQMAILKSDTTTETRLQGMNEFRQALTDQANNMMPRVESQGLHAAMTDKINKLENRIDMREGQMRGSRDTVTESRQNIGLYIALAMAALSIVAFVVKFH